MKKLSESNLNKAVEQEIQKMLTQGVQAASDDILKYSTKITTLMSRAVAEGRKDISAELMLQVSVLAEKQRIQMSEAVASSVTAFVGQTIRVLGAALVV